MTEREMENEVKELVLDYSYHFGEPCLELFDFLFLKGNLYKIETLMEQVEKDEDYG